MKKFCLGLAATLSTLAMTTGQVAANESRSVALNFYNSLQINKLGGGRATAVISSDDLVKAEMPSGNAVAFNVKGNRGFILVNYDLESPKVIGYSDKGSFDFSNLPPQLKKALEQPVSIKKTVEESNSSSPVVQYETAEWGQYAPFNDLCPTVEGEKAPAGCVATAMAIVMKYHNWPDCTRGGEETDFYFPDEKFDFDGYTIDWNALTDKNSPEFASQAATLTYSAGVAAQMIYGEYESGAEVWTVSHQLQYFYAYDKECQHIPRDKFDDAQWDAMLRTQLDEVGPVIYHGFGTGGHCFVIDGYNSDGMYHVNWGWDGGSNGYFSLDFSLEGGMSFGEAQGMIINIKPDRDKKQYSKAWIPNADAYTGGVFGCNGWNFSSPDIVPGEKFDFRIPSMCVGDFRGYFRVAIADDKDNVVGLTDCWLHVDGYRYFCPFPGTDPTMEGVTLPALGEGQRYQLVTQEAPNEIQGPPSLETGYYPAYPPSENPADWDIVLGGIVNPSYFYQTGNRSEVSEVRFHIDESMPVFNCLDMTAEHEYTFYRLKGGDCPANLIIPRKGVTLEVTCADKNGNPGEPLFVGEQPDYPDNLMCLNVSMYDDQFDVYVKYEFDGDTRKDSGYEADQIVEQDGLVYVLEGGDLTLIGYDKVGESVTIPASIVVKGTELPVTQVATEALMFAPVKNIILEGKELTIGKLSFAGMKELESVSFGEMDLHTPSWGTVPFTNSGLKTVYLNDTSVSAEIFSNMTGFMNGAKQGVAVKDIDFVLTALPQSDPNEIFINLFYFNSYGPDDVMPTTFGSYIIPGIGGSDISQFTMGLGFNIKQMWTYEKDENLGLVRIDSLMDCVEIEGILINGIEATADADGIYSISTFSPEAGMTVTVNYTINGLKKTAVYSPELNINLPYTDLNQILPGDLSGDGMLDMTDVNILKDHIKSSDIESLDMNIVDINNDGEIDMTDVNLLKDKILKD